MSIIVVKRDGTEKDFDPDKIARVVTAAGLKSQEGLMLALDASDWVKSLKKDKVTSIEIRDYVVKKMREINDHAANVYQWYEESKHKKLD